MSNFSYQVVEHNGIDCLLVMIESIGPTEVYIPLDEIMRDALWRGYVKEPDQASVVDYDIVRRLEAIERQLSEQGINDLAIAIERRIISRMRYGRNPYIEI